MSTKELIYLKLEDEDYAVLVSGGQVDKTDRRGNKVHLILSDIGWRRMLDHVLSAMVTESRFKTEQVAAMRQYKAALEKRIEHL